MSDNNNNDAAWRRLDHLGQLISDGDHEGMADIRKEYRKLSKALIPGLKEQDKEKRKAKAQLIDEQMKRLLTSKDCECGGKIVQKRKGSKVAYCEICGARYEARCKNKGKQ